MSKASMMFKIVQLLQTHYMLSSSALADILETTPRNIKAYIEALRAEGVPIEGLSGKSGGDYLEEGYQFKPQKLDEAEYSALLLAEDFLTKENGFLYEHEIRTAFAKIKAAQQDGVSQFEPTKGEKSIFCQGNVDILREIKDKLSIIRKAILDRNTLEILYGNLVKRETTSRPVDPYNLIFRDDSWYMIGYCHLRQGIRTFKLTRILEITQQDSTYEIPSNFSIRHYMRDTFNIMKGRECNVEIEFTHPASAWVSEKLWLPSQRIMELDENTILFQARVNGLTEIKKWVLGFGGLAKVLKPAELMEEVAQEAQKIHQRYSP